MIDSPETPKTPRFLTVNTDQHWSAPLHKHFKLRGFEYESAKDIDVAIELLNSGDFTAVITDGLKGNWRTMVDEAAKLGVRPIVVSSSATAIPKVEAQGVAAFHTASCLTNEGMDTIVRAATRPKETEQEL